MSKILKIAIPLVVIAGVIYGFSLYYTPRKNVESEDIAYKVSAKELTRDFSGNEASANEKYLGKVVQVTGEVVELIREEESFGILLDGGIDGSVYCAFNEAPQVVAGQTVSVKGICSGYLMDVVINDCILTSANP